MDAERIKQLEQLLEQDPNDTFSLYAIAMEYIGKGDFGKAAEYLERLLGVDEDYVPAYLQLAKLLLKLGQKGKALEVIEKGYSKADQNAQYHIRDKLLELKESVV